MATTAVLDIPVPADAVRRVRAAYVSQPALSLTKPQARRLFSLDPATTDEVLRQLVREHFLVATREAQFVRPR